MYRILIVALTLTISLTQAEAQALVVEDAACEGLTVTPSDPKCVAPYIPGSCELTEGQVTVTDGNPDVIYDDTLCHNCTDKCGTNENLPPPYTCNWSLTLTHSANLSYTATGGLEVGAEWLVSVKGTLELAVTEGWAKECSKTTGGMTELDPCEWVGYKMEMDLLRGNKASIPITLKAKFNQKDAEGETCPNPGTLQVTANFTVDVTADVCKFSSQVGPYASGTCPDDPLPDGPPGEEE